MGLCAIQHKYKQNSHLNAQCVTGRKKYQGHHVFLAIAILGQRQTRICTNAQFAMGPELFGGEMICPICHTRWEAVRDESWCCMKPKNLMDPPKVIAEAE
jgi:hypothetical protein